MFQPCPALPELCHAPSRGVTEASRLEHLCGYPGWQTLLGHHLAHWLYLRRIPLLPRLISQFSRLLTGIEIHPGAVLGRGVEIRQGMGVVIGETAIVGDYSIIYQDVTLGGTGKQTGKRHPTLGQGVVVEPGAKILGNITVGDFAQIGPASVVLKDVPAYHHVMGIPGRDSGEKRQDMDALVIRSLVDRLEALEQQVAALKVKTLQKQQIPSVGAYPPQPAGLKPTLTASQR